MSLPSMGIGYDSSARGLGPKRDNEPDKGRHTHLDFPHLSSATGACMCERACCFGKSGCHCPACSGAGHEGCNDPRTGVSIAARAARRDARQKGKQKGKQK